MKALRVLVIAALIAPFAYSAYHADWQAVLSSGNHNYLMNLQPSPVWKPPVPPSYADFKAKFENLPAETESTVSAHHMWRSTFLDSALGLWAVAAVLAAVHVVVRKRFREPSLVLAAWLFVSIAAAALLCLILYFLVGGWGPPLPDAFALAGIVGGIALFLRQSFNRKNA